MTTARPSAVIVLAAGAGTRFKSSMPKVLHELCGRSMVHHALVAAAGTNPEHIVAVVRFERERVAEHIAQVAPEVNLADQDDVPGTGRAVECAMATLPQGLTGTVVVSYGDVPLLEAQTLQELVDHHQTGGHGVSVLTAQLADPTGYGRIVRDQDGGVAQIVEHKDAAKNSPELLEICEVNSGIYAFDAELLAQCLPQITTDNAQGEKYLTDMVALAVKYGRTVSAHPIDDVAQTEGANDRYQLSQLADELNARIMRRHMLAGVTIVAPCTTRIDVDVVCEPDVTILPGVQLHGTTSLATGCTVGPDSTLTNVTVGAGATVCRTHGVDSVVGEGADVGPFSYLRPGTDLGEQGKIGTFVETKKAKIGAGSKIPHLSYVGDATIGVDTNIGAASVFVNYDGVKKHHTTIGSHCRLGSDNMYVAPVTVGDGAYTGAGTVVRKDVPAGALAINVAPQRNMLGWVVEKRPGTAAAKAAEEAS